ncbi:unnamed protein product [Paramecium sonneborni]|uniref:Uncharacterized protein n=1 Tax=Paramecium sonneborni TaxID=65129 RepID=A0A8S1LRQ2_9CILI|nr:unnamed protein product [Paramecium sonneborni]
MQDNYEKFRNKFTQIQSFDIYPRLCQISMNFDCSTILVLQINNILKHYQRNGNIWDLIISQKLSDKLLSLQINFKGTILAMITRSYGYFWIEYMIFNKRRWIYKNRYKLKQDPDPYISIQDYKISDNLQLCSYKFQWNGNYQRINSFSLTSLFKRITRSKIKGLEVIFPYHSNFFVVLNLDKMGLKVFRSFQYQYILYQTQFQINSYMIESNSTILIHTVELILWNFKTDKKTKIKTPYDMFQESKSNKMNQIGNLLLVQFQNEIALFEEQQQKLKYITTYQCRKSETQFSSERQLMIEIYNNNKIVIYQIIY